MRRRLLQAAEEPGIIVTKNPTCQDALEFDVPFLHNTRMACLEAFKSSSETVLMLNNSLLPCTFCSSEDLLYAIQFQTDPECKFHMEASHLSLLPGAITFGSPAEGKEIEV